MQLAELEKLLNTLKERVPFNNFKGLLRKHELPLGVGAENTVKKILKKAEEKEELLEKGEALAQDYKDFLIAGEKAIKLFQVTPAVVDAFINNAEELTVDNGLFENSYPFFLKSEDLNRIDNSVLFFVKSLRHRDGIFLIFFSKRSFFDRQTINLQGASQEIKSYLGDFDEVIGIKKKEAQFSDIVFINKRKKLVEYRLDNRRRFSPEDRKRGFDLIHKKMIDLFGSIDVRGTLINTVNFFPSIAAFYDSAEGRVCELGFTTDEASIKYEKMRRKDIDLRSETYHFAGKRAVGDIGAFKIAIVWEKENYVDEDIELLIPGTYRIFTNNPLIDESIITGCMNQNDHENVVNKIIALLDI